MFIGSISLHQNSLTTQTDPQITTGPWHQLCHSSQAAHTNSKAAWPPDSPTDPTDHCRAKHRYAGGCHKQDVQRTQCLTLNNLRDLERCSMSKTVPNGKASCVVDSQYTQLLRPCSDYMPSESERGHRKRMSC